MKKGVTTCGDFYTFGGRYIFRSDEKRESSDHTGTDRKRERRKRSNENRCACCLRPFIISRGIRCIDCGARACRDNCSKLDRRFVGRWCCLFCQQRRIWLEGRAKDLENLRKLDLRSFVESLVVTSRTDESSMAPSEQIQDCFKGLNVLLQNGSTDRNKRDASTLTSTASPKSLTVTVEEHVEEVETCVTNGSSKHECENCLNFQKSHRVPFPELGMDIIDPYQESLETNQDEIDDLEPTKIISLIESWEENWLFRRKNIRGSTKPVAMFVPNSNTEYRAMIGEKDAEETSDLSEYSTHSDEEFDKELMLEMQNIMLSNAKCNGTSINKIPLDVAKVDDQNFDEIDDVTNANGCAISEQLINHTSYLSEAQLIIDNDVTSNSVCSDVDVDVVTVETKAVIEHEEQRDSDYIEQDMTLTRTERIDTSEDCITKAGVKIEDEINEELTEEPSSLPLDNEISETEINLCTPPKPGSIADREHKKWENAVPIENNPYSKENIQKRLQQKRYTTSVYDISGKEYNFKILNPNQEELDYKKSFELMCQTELIPNLDDQSIIRQSEEDLRISNYDAIVNANSFDPDQTIDDTCNEILESSQRNNKNKVLTKMNNQDLTEESLHNEIPKNSESKLMPKDINYTSNLTSDKRCKSIDSLKRTDNISNFIDKENKNVLFENKSSPQSLCATPIKLKKSEIMNGDNLNKNYSVSRSLEDFTLNSELDNEITMPSVKKLVQIFSSDRKEGIHNTSPVIKKLKELESSQLKPIQIQSNQLPRKLHSLTARSLSKEFREELRQMTHKNSYLTNKKEILDNIIEKQCNNECHSNEFNGFEHGNLKSNIQFWEQMQKRK